MEAHLISAPYHLLPAVVGGAICAWACAGRPKRARRVAAATLLLGLPLQSWFLVRPGPVATWLGWPDLALRDRCNWEPEQVHAVVLFGFEPGLALIGDPRFGFERWGTRHFDALWLGQAIELR